MTFAALAVGISVAKSDTSPTHRAQPGNLVVVGMPGLTWSDINPDTTPTLWDMSRHAAVGNQLVRVIS
ncbi:hypothetical protein, partial [Rhodoplanes serenus]|uniref:hypothetical protein n=1 Tax=Rhodoplanes serenus TaxID=200615 RepID=UPI001A9347C6